MRARGLARRARGRALQELYAAREPPARIVTGDVYKRQIPVHTSATRTPAAWAGSVAASQSRTMSARTPRPGPDSSVST